MRFAASLLGLFATSSLLAQTITLHQGWSFQEAGSSAWHTATVPGTVHTDLLAHGLIPDPYFGTNEDSVQWVSDKDWIYRATFNVSEEMLHRQFQLLRFHGLDTYCDVRLNDSLILEANNMFRRFDVDVKGLLRNEENELELLFRSPIKEGDALLEQFKMELPGDEFSKGKKSSMFSRKAAYHYGWDWGPRLVTSGIWKPIELIAWDGARIDRVSVRTDSLFDKKAWMIADIELTSGQEDVTITLVHPKRQDTITSRKFTKTGSSTVIPFTVMNPELWWSNGSGEPNLHDIEVIMEQRGEVVDRVSIQYGIRTVELINEKDSIGTSFYFKVNGEPIFMRGANYIPQDIFTPRVTKEDQYRLITDVKRANMNMLRVWGGGIYESDEFYNQCDENGILVWQDLMFANALYPVSDSFRKHVQEEISQQVDRLKGHACIALWCGNNEIDIAWNNWGWQDKFSAAQKHHVEFNYNELFQELAPTVIGKQAPGLPYVHTSPLSNWGTAENFNHHNMHYWGVWHGPDDFSGYQQNVPRFMSEYGFQSFPAIGTLLSAIENSDLEVGSDAMQAHQKSYVGNGMIDQFVKQYFREPHDFDDMVYLSQLTQQLGMRTAIKAHRTSAKCMGTLYWQLNDVWPGASWSTIDHSGKWKAAMYEVKRLYEPAAVLVTNNEDKLAVHVVNDGPAAIEGQLIVSVHRINGSKTHEQVLNFTQPANTRNVELRSKASKLVSNRDQGERYVRARLLQGDQVLSTDIHFLVDPAELKLMKPNIELELRPDGSIEMSTDQLAYGVELHLKDVEFSDNHFILEPGNNKIITQNAGSRKIGDPATTGMIGDPATTGMIGNPTTIKPITEEQFKWITWRSFHN